MAEHFLGLGAELYLCGRRLGVLEKAREELLTRHPGKVTVMTCDIRNDAAVEAMIERIWSEGPLTTLVNNAAGNFVCRTQDLSMRGFDAVTNICFRGTFCVTQNVGRRWIQEQIPGTILCLLTTWIWTGSPYVLPSVMAKTGIDAMIKSLAVEWGPKKIRINGIAPGTFPTEGASARLSPGSQKQARGDQNPWGRVGLPHELQNLATFLVSDGCDFLTGQTVAVDGGGYLAHGASFTELAGLSDEEWRAMRTQIQAANARDKAQRST